MNLIFEGKRKEGIGSMEDSAAREVIERGG